MNWLMGIIFFVTIMFLAGSNNFLIDVGDFIYKMEQRVDIINSGYIKAKAGVTE